MGRNKQHQKQLRSEKAKIKLKVNKTKFLPKGQNVTDASFKIKPIILPEQLKVYDGGVFLNKKNLTLKEVLNKLDHHNKTAIEDACEQLKQIFEQGDSINTAYLPVLLKRLCPLILHEKNSVRQKVLKTLDTVLAKANTTTVNGHRTTSSLSPFYPILMSFLRSALTHIKRLIREDSLHYLDLLIHRVPDMLATHADTLLPIYLSLMSTHSSTNAPNESPTPKQIKKTIIVDLDSKMTIVIWRIKVLARLYAILETIGLGRGVEEGSFRDNVPIIDITENKPYPLIIDYLSDTAVNLFNYSEQNIESSVGSVKNNINNIFCILFDTWSEVTPAKTALNNSEDTILTFETAEVLRGILKIIYLLWNTILNQSDISKLTTRNADRFFNNLLNLFPFHKRVTNNNVQHGYAWDDQRCSQDNLILCYIFAVANPKLYKQDKIEFGRKVAAYLNSCLINRSLIKHNDIVYLIRCLSVIFKKNASSWQRGNSVNMDQLLTNTINYQVIATFNKELFNVLCDLIQVKSLESLPVYAMFLSNIPSLLCKKEISADTIDKILWISLQRNKVFCTNLLECLPDILKNFADIQIIESAHDLINYKLRILYIFENCPHMNNRQMEYFKAFVGSFNEENEYTKYVRQWILQEQ